VSYKGNRYQINTGMMDAHKRIRIEDDGEMLLFYDAETNDLLAKYPVTKDTGSCSNQKKITGETGFL